MSRNIDSTMASHLPDGVVYPAVLAKIVFRSAISYAWTGVGPLTWNGMTFLGLGSLAGIGPVAEGSSVQADGTTVSLSAIDNTLRTECLTDIAQGRPAQLWLAMLNAQGQVQGTPYLLFKGSVDQPRFRIGESMDISLSLESRAVNGQRAGNRRYTAADQALTNPLDSGFVWVEPDNDIALIWGG
jgi:hypothetical protein